MQSNSLVLVAVWAARGHADPQDPPTFAFVVATRDGARTSTKTVEVCSRQADMFVVSDGSVDDVVEGAWAAGATVALRLDEDVGKPAAIYQLLRQLRLHDRYELIRIVDDDTGRRRRWLSGRRRRRSANPPVDLINRQSRPVRVSPRSSSTTGAQPVGSMPAPDPWTGCTTGSGRVVPDVSSAHGLWASSTSSSSRKSNLSVAQPCMPDPATGSRYALVRSQRCHGERRAARRDRVPGSDASHRALSSSGEPSMSLRDECPKPSRGFRRAIARQRLDTHPNIVSPRIPPIRHSTDDEHESCQR